MVHRNRKGSKLQAPSMARGWPQICTNWRKQLTRRRKRKRHCETTATASDEHPRERGRQSNSCTTKQQHHQLQELDASQNIPSTSSSEDHETGHEFEVFLSFRGFDNRKTFTDCLYHSLMDAGIRTFRDNEELRVGEEIGPELMKSIKQSKIAIPIFSKNYASSKWCLKEVEEMAKCMKETKQLIMPVFLDVTPDEVQHQTGSFADPFALHEKSFGTETVRGWRHALKEVVKLKGLGLDAEANGHQGKFTKLIVARVIGQLKKSHLEVSNILVGIEDRAEELMKKLAVDIDDTRFVGVWGMGGIGKSTLAKFVYNRIVDNVKQSDTDKRGSSFLSNIRETSGIHRGLQRLQSQLASDILQSGQVEFNNIGEGINVLKESFRDKRVLILLDDVGHLDQLKALAGDVKWFGPGSRIIITTREKEVLDQCGVQDTYEVALLDENQALELFCQHAFGDKLPRTGFVEMARDITKITGRLPLALEVIGSSLSSYGGRKDMWESKIEKLKIRPHNDVQDKLKISYESLDREEKEIFLDIACFFIGMDKRLVIPMWNDLNFCPVAAIETLCLKSLIKIREDNTIWMHDVLRDFGRDIVAQEDKEPGQRSRLWCSKDAIDVLERQLASSKLEAICLEHFKLVDGMVKNLPRLRFLELNGVVLDGNFQDVFCKLRWLGCHRKNESLSMNLIMNNLIILDLSWSFIPENWTGWSLIKLKVLNLGHCQIRRTPNFSAFPSLEILILAWCHDLVYVDPSIGLLKNLILLDLRHCMELQALPKELGSLESLVELLIDFTRVKEIPISRNMKKLEILSANWCLSLEEIPASIGSLENLKRLHLKDCKYFQAIPELPSGLISLKVGRLSSPAIELGEDCLSKLEELKNLNLKRVSTLPKEMSSFLRLENICLSMCSGLECVPKLPSSLSVLRIDFCLSLQRLLDLSNLKNLLRLEVRSCFRLKEIEGLGDLLSLKILSTIHTPLIKLDGLERLEFLNEICVNDSEVERLPDLSKLKGLRRLDLSHNHKLVEIQSLCSLKKLKELVMRCCPSLEFLGELPDCLKSLSVARCRQLRKLTDLSKLQGLEYLNVQVCISLVEIPGVEELGDLRELHIARCNALKLPHDQLKQKRNLSVIKESTEPDWSECGYDARVMFGWERMKGKGGEGNGGERGQYLFCLNLL